MNKLARRNVYVSGHAGMLGSSIARLLSKDKNLNIITATKENLDLRDQADVVRFFKTNRIDEIYIAAAKVGGISANITSPAEYCYDNMIIPANIIHAAYTNNIRKLLFISSSCVYPKNAKQPIAEHELLSAPFEATNEPFAIAKVAGLKLVESYNRQYVHDYFLDYRSVMIANLYGTGDNYDAQNSHVIPALIRRFHDAKLARLDTVAIWGSGMVRREFLTSDDAAAGCIHVMGLDQKQYLSITNEMCRHLNIGAGKDITIRDLAALIAEVVGYVGNIQYDVTKPDGTFRKLLDSTKLVQTGWSASTSLKEGLQNAYRDFCNNQDTLRT